MRPETKRGCVRDATSRSMFIGDVYLLLAMPAAKRTMSLAGGVVFCTEGRSRPACGREGATHVAIRVSVREARRRGRQAYVDERLEHVAAILREDIKPAVVRERLLEAQQEGQNGKIGKRQLLAKDERAVCGERRRRRSVQRRERTRPLARLVHVPVASICVASFLTKAAAAVLAASCFSSSWALSSMTKGPGMKPGQRRREGKGIRNPHTSVNICKHQNRSGPRHTGDKGLDLVLLLLREQRRAVGNGKGNVVRLGHVPGEGRGGRKQQQGSGAMHPHRDDSVLRRTNRCARERAHCPSRSPR